MKCEGNFVFKSIEHVDAGEFKNPNGDVVKYPGSYKLSVDEWIDGKINEVKFKIPESSSDLVNQLRVLKPYQDIKLECSVNFYNNVIRIVPIKVQKLENSNK